MEKILLDQMITRIPVMERVGLIREVCDIPDSVTLTPSSKSPDIIKFTFFGDTCSFNCNTILSNSTQFTKYLADRVKKAESQSTEENSIIEALSNEKEFDVKEFYELQVPNATTEDELAEIFENDFTEFKKFYNSPSRQKLNQETRGFIFQVMQNPFMPLWDNDSSESI